MHRKKVPTEHKDRLGQTPTMKARNIYVRVQPEDHTHLPPSHSSTLSRQGFSLEYAPSLYPGMCEKGTSSEPEFPALPCPAICFPRPHNSIHERTFSQNHGIATFASNAAPRISIKGEIGTPRSFRKKKEMIKSEYTHLSVSNRRE